MLLFWFLLVIWLLQKIPSNLKDSSHVWLRIDRVRKSLEAPYQGLYRLLSINGKTATISLHNSEQTVSVNRLKKANIRQVDDHPPTPVIAPPPSDLQPLVLRRKKDSY